MRLEEYYDSAVVDFPLGSRVLAGVAYRAVRLVSRLLYPWKIEDAELLTGDARGRVVIMNHESMLDPCVIVPVMALAGIPVRIVYKSEFDKIGIASWFFARVGGFPVSRGEADMKVIRRAKAMLSRGECILIFPEGTRVKDDAQAEVHGGFALMAELAKAPVQPMAIVGARELRLRKRVWLRAGATVEWSELSSAKRKEKVAEMQRVAMERVYALRDALRAEHPGVE